MSFNDCKISESQIQTTGVQSRPDTLTGSAADNKMVFDALPTLVIQKLNSLIDQMQQQAAAGQIGVTPFDGMTAQTLQDALEQIQADIGGNYSGADGAGKVGYTPSEGVDEDTVQEAIEAVQANLTAYIAKIKAATGAAEVGNAPIAGMTATNVQQALEELRENIDNIVSGIIPGGSITSDMLQDGAVTADKLGSDVTGEEIPTSASDPTSISSQLSNKLNASNFISITGDTDLHTLNAGVYILGAGANVSVEKNWPYTGCFFGFVVVFRDKNIFPDDHGAIICISESKNEVYRQTHAYATWSKWKEESTATPPQVRNLTLQSGFTANSICKFFVTQESIVFLAGGVAGNIPAGEDIVIGMLQADACPSELSRYSASTNTGSAYIDIHPDGKVCAHVYQTASYFWFDVSFEAGGGL